MGVAIVVLLLAVAGLRQLARARTVQVFGRLVDRVETAEMRVALSFDDGPAPAAIDSILSVLGERRVRATFFINGAPAAEHPGLAAQLVSSGHELGNHTWSHRRMVMRRQAFYRDEVVRTDSLIRAAGHQGPIYFRPPYGYKLFGLPWLLQRTGRTTVTWDIEPDSYSEVAATSEGIVLHVLERVRPGSIIILHAWFPSRATSLAAIGPLVDSLHARGYRVGTVRDLLGPQHRLAQPGR
ncbi:MAG: polysaccharide deacetylase family protein [Gemmatimonadaceae bacterium]|nr:polysaccharide deacetylase family protein [Gemmatimonadaceae bacterium]